MLSVPIQALLVAAVATTQIMPQPEPAQPHIQAGWYTSNLFWPGETDALTNTTYACTYVGQVVEAGDRLIAFGGCNANPAACNGYHYAIDPHPTALASRGDGNTSACIKYSEDSGRSWSRIRMIWTQAGECFGYSGLVYDRRTEKVVIHFPKDGSIFQTTSKDQGDTWTPIVNVSSMLATDGGWPWSDFDLNVGPGAGLQLSDTNPHAPGRLLFAGHHGRYSYDGVWYSDDHGDTWSVSTNASTGDPARFVGLDEPALAETPSGGVTLRARNFIFHGPGQCDCRGKVDSDNGGTSFQGGVGYDAELPEPVCQGTMINYGDTGAIIFSAMPGFGTDKEAKDGHNGRGNGVVRWSIDGGLSWLGNVSLWHGFPYSYSCLTRVPEQGFLGLAWETVLPDSGPHKRDISANNVVFTLVPAGNLTLPKEI